MDKRKSAVFTINEALWRRFKALVAARGLTVGGVFVRFIRDYLKEDSG